MKRQTILAALLLTLTTALVLAIPPNKESTVEQAARDLRAGNGRLRNESDLATYATGLMDGTGTSIIDLTNVNTLQELRDAFASQTIQTIASATATPLGTSTSDYVVISGTTTITSFTTASAGVKRYVRFSGALTLTHNGTNLILGGAVNRTTVAGDTALFVSEGSGNWRELVYYPTTATGTGARVQAAAPTLVTPVISTGLSASGSAANTFAGSTGTFLTSSGANTLSGDVTVAAGKDVTYAAGDGLFDGSLGTGIFKTTTGANTFGGSSNAFTNAITPTGGVAAAGGFSVSARLMHSGGAPPQVNTDGTDATPSVSETYICEVFVPANVTLTGVSVFLGSATEGNVKVGLADSTGAVVATSASTDISAVTADSYIRVPFTGTYAAKGPATYYVLLLNDNTGNRFNTHTFGDFGASKKTGETYATGFTTITPPTTFTTALGPISSLY